MTHGWDPNERPPDEKVHPKYLQTAFSEAAERLAEKLDLGAKRGRESRKKRALNSDGNENV